MMARALAVLLLSSCTKDAVPDGPRGSCDPLDPAKCALPYPSSFYLESADTPTGQKVSYAADSLPMNRDFVQVTPDYWNEKDGFSTHGPFMTYFADLSLEGVVGNRNIGDYALPDASVLVIDTTTGERVPAWAEIDMSAEDPAERLLMIWPAVQLDFGRTYVVGLRGLVTNAGTPVQPSEAFAALRDGTATDDYDIEFRRQHFEDVVFPALAADGVARSDLQLAWDFTTVSRKTSLGRMEFIRDDGLARVDAGVTYAISNRVDHDCTTDGPIAREFIFKAQIPSYMVDPAPNSMLTRDASGMPYYNGDMDAGYLVRIPCSVALDPKPSFVLSYGHGLLGGKDEAYTSWLGHFADDNKMIVLAHDWIGMSTLDAPAITVAIVNDPARFAIVPERSHEGFLAAMAGLRIVDRQLVNDDAVKFPNADGVLVSVIDPDNHGYYGISQGGIMGGALVAMSPDLDRGVLGVPGAPYSMLLHRSRDFEEFFRIFKEKFTDHRDVTMMIGMYEAIWEPAEAGGWMHDMSEAPEAGYEGKRVLLQPAIGDAQVTTLAGQMMARMYGAKSIIPAARPIWGVDEVAPPYEGNAITEFAYSDAPEAESEPIINVPTLDVPDPHECPRREAAGQVQVNTFLTTGVVTQPCDGVCGSSVAVTCP